MEVIFAQFGKFVFDAEAAAEKVEAKVVDLDLCDQKGSISGVTLIPDFERQITEYEIFAPRYCFRRVINECHASSNDLRIYLFSALSICFKGAALSYPVE